MPGAACLGQVTYRVPSPTLACVREGPPPGAPHPADRPTPRLLDQIRAAVRLRVTDAEFSRGRTRVGIHRRSRSAYPATPRSMMRQHDGTSASPEPARPVARATTTTPEQVSGYMEQSTCCSP